jgi:phytoene dehydrogenase-like protein
MPDAIVVGAGQNGLVAANLLADRGWEVTVLEAQRVAGGAVRTAELTLPGYRHDVFSAFYPLTAASSIYRSLELESHGLSWRHTPLVLAHPASDGSCPVLSRDLEETAASLDDFAAGDGDAWRHLYELWERTGHHLLDALLTLFPPIRAAGGLARSLGTADLLRFARMALIPVRRMAEEEFSGVGGGRLLAGSALHADLTPESAGGGLYGWLLCGIGQQLGWPVPAGGAGQITDALVRRLESRGGRIVCEAEVTEVAVRRGRAVGVRTADGTAHPARRAVLADVGAPALYSHLVDRAHVPRRLLDDMRRFQYDNSTVKVDWALSGPIPWEAEDARRAGTVHVTDSMDELTHHSTQVVTGQLPDSPFLVLGQYAEADSSRAPAGEETAWAYTHVPQRVRGDARGELEGTWDERESELFADRMEAEVERVAPGFRDLIRARHILTPPRMEAMNQNLVNGALNGGTAQLQQQLVFRPTSGLARPETPIRRLFLASASAHPGGGVHGGPGANAARAALAADRPAVLGLGQRAAFMAARVVAERR